MTEISPKNIFIYNDEGSNSTECLISWIREHVPGCKIQEITAFQIKEGYLSKEQPDAIFIGGGRAMFYSMSLEENGRDEIRKYVKGGGLYYGICAGGYFAMSSFFYLDNVNGKRKKVEILKADHCLGLCSGLVMTQIRYSKDDEVDLKQVDVRYPNGVILINKRLYPSLSKSKNKDRIMAQFEYEGIKYPVAIESIYGDGMAYVLSINPADLLGEDAVKYDFSRYLLSALLDRDKKPTLPNKPKNNIDIKTEHNV